MQMISKKERYLDLVSRIKTDYCRHEASDTNLLSWCNVCQEINLWTYWQGRNHFDAKIMLVGQDWGSPFDKSAQNTMQQIQLANQDLPFEYLNENPSKTDERLILLFNEIGYRIEQPCDDLFFTNLVLGYRSKGCSGGFRKDWAKHDEGYFRELANIIEPKIILCLGRSTFEGVLDALEVELKPGIRSYNRFIESEKNPVTATLGNGDTIHVFALAHCGVLGTFNRNRGKKNPKDILEIQKKDWKRIINYL